MMMHQRVVRGILIGMLAGAAACAGSARDEANANVPIASSEVALQQDDLGDVDGFPIDADGYVPVPGGDVHRSCVHALRDGETVVQDSVSETKFVKDGKVVRRIAACGKPFRGNNRIGQLIANAPPDRIPAAARASFASSQGAGGFPPGPAINGWTDFSWTNSTTFNGFNFFNWYEGQWTVPAAPAPANQKGQLLYLFNSLQGTWNGLLAIIQPVLQWGVGAPNGGGYTWEIASWWVATNISTGAVVSTVYSPREPVSAGNTLDGLIASGGCNSSGQCSWTITTSSSNGSWTQLPVNLAFTFWNAEPGVLEVRNVTKCNQLPASGSTQFFNLFLYQPNTNPNDYVEVFMTSPWSNWQNQTSWPIGSGDLNCGWFVNNTGWRASTLVY